MTARDWIVALNEDRHYSVPAAVYESDISAIQADARSGVEAQCAGLKKEIDTLKKALRFYADEQNWNDGYGTHGRAGDDKGQLATQALEEPG